jgi:hypothetical protein
MRTRDPASLAPARRAWLPRRCTLLRLSVVAVLLLTAAGVLHAGAAGGRVDADPPLAADTAERADQRQTGAAGAAADHRLDVAGVPAVPERLPVPAGLVGVPVRLGDPAGLAVLRPGDRVDLLAVAPGEAPPVTVASAASVLAVDRPGAALLLALTPAQGRTVLAIPTDASLAVIVR